MIFNQNTPIIVDLGNGVTMTFCHIPAGEFWMGTRSDESKEFDEQPRHRVIVPKAFYMAETPITLGQFKAFDKGHKNESSCKSQSPVDSVSWFDARKFADWVNGLQKCNPALISFSPSLPTEAQWEYACRAGTETEYWSGDGEAALSVAGWFVGNSGREAKEVKGRSKNKFGLYDMHGLNEEWCLDRYDKLAYSKRLDGQIMIQPAPEDLLSLKSTTQMVFRGGAFRSIADKCRSHRRAGREARNKNDLTGFRLALNLR